MAYVRTFSSTLLTGAGYSQLKLNIRDGLVLVSEGTDLVMLFEETVGFK